MSEYVRNELVGSLSPVNAELEKIEQALKGKLGREGGSLSTNVMNGDLDLNGFSILNVKGLESPSPSPTPTPTPTPTAGVTSVNTRTGDVVLTKQDVGLNNVDNTSDLDKPISTAVQASLIQKADAAATTLALNSKADAAATTAALALKADITYVDSEIAAIQAGGSNGTTNLSTSITTTQVEIVSDTGTNAIIPSAGVGAAGVMSASDKTKLNGIASNATANATDAQLRDRSTHTGTQAIDTVTGLQTALDSKQATLVSGTNIKTINGQSILGTGDITISGGGVAIASVQRGTISISSGSGTVSISPVDLQKSFLNFTGFSNGTAGRVFLSAANTISYSKTPNAAAVSWEVIEYV